MALIDRAGHRVGVDSSTRYVVDLFKTLPALTDSVLGRSIRNNDRDEVAVGFSLHRERLSEGEGDGIWKVSSLLGRAFLLGFRRGIGGVSSTFAFGSLLGGEGGGLSVFRRTEISTANREACRGLDAVETSL
jgi:hypothetical protein